MHEFDRQEHEHRLAQDAIYLARTRHKEESARQALAQSVAAAAAAGMSLYRIGQITGLARGTVHKWAHGDT